MNAKCWKCGAGFRFDEARIQAKALLRCPSCKTRNLLIQDPNSPEPKYYVMPYGDDAKAAEEKQARETAPVEKKPVTPKIEAPPKDDSNESSVLRDEPFVIEKTATPKAETTAPVGIQTSDASKVNDAGGELEIPDMPMMENLQSGADRFGNEYRPEALERSEAPSLPDRSSPPRSDFKPDRFIPQTERQQRMMSPPPKMKKAGFPLKGILLLVLVVALLGGSAVLIIPELGDRFGGHAEVDDLNKPHPGKVYIENLRGQLGLVQGEPLHLVKQAETAFRQDLEPGYQTALNLFERAMVLDSDNAEIIVRYVESYVLVNQKLVKVEKVRAMMDLLDYASALSPGLSSIYRARARIFLLLDQPTRALEVAERARRLDPNNKETQVVLGEGYIDVDPTRAVEILQPIADSPTPPKAVLLPLALAYQKLGNLSAAEATLVRRDAIDPGTCALCEPLGAMYVTIGLFDKAEAVFERLSQKHPESPAGTLGLALNIWQSGGEVSEAYALLDGIGIKQIEQYQPYERVALYCAKSHYSTLEGNFEVANGHASKALQIDNHSVCGRYLLVLTAVLANDLPASKTGRYADILESLTIDAKDLPETWVLNGIFAHKSGDLKLAMTHYQKALQIDFSYKHAHLLLAQMYIDAMNFNKAFEIIEGLNRYIPDYWDQHPSDNMLTDRFDYAEELLAQLENVEGSQADLDRKFRSIGLVAFHNGMFTKAETAFSRLLENAEDDAVGNLYMAFISLKAGGLVTANQYADKVLLTSRSDPKATVVKALIVRREKNAGEARQLLQRVLSAHGENAPLLALTSLFAGQSGKTEQAQTTATMAWRVDSSSRRVKLARYLAGI